MTLTYARISDRTVADEYFRVTEAVEAGYRNTQPTGTDIQGPNMRRLAADHRRLLGNGHCTRPVALDCTFESICESCGFFETGPQFVPILRKQRDHATNNDQHDRAHLFTQLLDAIHDIAERASMSPAQARPDHPCNNTLVTRADKGGRALWVACSGTPCRRRYAPRAV